MSIKNLNMLFFIVFRHSCSGLSCCEYLAHVCRRKKELKARTVWLGHPEKCEEKYPKNAIKNQKYNVLTFVPGVSVKHTHTHGTQELLTCRMGCFYYLTPDIQCYVTCIMHVHCISLRSCISVLASSGLDE